MRCTKAHAILEEIRDFAVTNISELAEKVVSSMGEIGRWHSSRRETASPATFSRSRSVCRRPGRNDYAPNYLACCPSPRAA